MDISSIPVDLNEFFLWFGEQTEKIWLNYNTLTFEDFKRTGLGGLSWRKGTKWLRGYNQEEITSAEQKWDIKFPPDYCLFLSILGAPDRLQYGTRWTSTGMEEIEEGSFCNWIKNSENIQLAMNKPFEGLFYNLEHNPEIWRDKWGKRPDDLENQKKYLSELIQTAPPLIPIYANRYLVGLPIRMGNPVLSINQSDIIIYGTDLRKYLINEFASFLGIDKSEAYRYAVNESFLDLNMSIPFWEDFIL